jgi:putative endonuclease
MWHLYITSNRNGAFYVGITEELSRRVREHFTGKSGQYTRRNPARQFLYSECFKTKVAAETREQQIKRWSRKKKKALIEGSIDELRKLSISRDHMA